MKRLTLIRHAKSSWSNQAIADFDRPLSERGLRDAPKMGAHFKTITLPPVERMISSPALRARTTADLIAQELGLAAERLTLEPRIYEASPKPMKRDPVNIFKKNGGQMRMSEALEQGLSRHAFDSLRDEGSIESISRGVYRLVELPPVSNPDLVAISLRYPNAVVCLISALSYHGITTQIPHEISLAIPRDRPTGKLKITLTDGYANILRSEPES